ncbi:MAG TPA: signal peptidase I [Mollicutes bacterium]|nr:signal peptidase I [Mollicutes bacterium]
MDLREVKEFLLDSLLWITIFLIVIFIFTYIISLQTIAGNSMHPTYKNGDLVLVNKLTFRFSRPKRFDIVTVVDDEGKTYVKRIIGLPGESIHYLDNILYINNTELKEEFLSKNFTKNFFLEDICNYCINNKIPEGKYLLLGDNRIDSLDSRDQEFGLRDLKDIKGKILFKLFSFL